MPKTIAIVGTMDTKGREMKFIKDIVEARGHKTVVIDTGLLGEPYFASDISRAEVARAGGKSFEELVANPTREISNPTMGEGVAKIVTDLASQGKINGIISLGGTQGTAISTTAMRALPVGFPKVMVSTMASGNTAPYVDIKDITMMFSVTDILGLNQVSRRILANAAGAVCGMAETEIENITSDRPLVAVTTVGITTPCAMKAISLLEEKGFETIVFHAVGTGGRAMESLIEQGLIKGVLDIATLEVSNELWGGLLDAGPRRLTVAGQMGIPQVLAPGAVPVIVFGEPHTVPEKYKNRKLVAHSPKITDVRLDKEEEAGVGEVIGKRVSGSKGPVVFFIPKKGYDSYSAEGNVYWDPEADQAFVDALQSNLRADIPIEFRDVDINNPGFAEEMVNTLVELMSGKGAR